MKLRRTRHQFPFAWITVPVSVALAAIGALPWWCVILCVLSSFIATFE